MAENILDKFEKEQLKEHPEFRTGDTVVVQVKVTEGKRTRLQAFEGLVISKKNRGLNSSNLEPSTNLAIISLMSTADLRSSLMMPNSSSLL